MNIADIFVCVMMCIGFIIFQICIITTVIKDLQNVYNIRKFEKVKEGVILLMPAFVSLIFSIVFTILSILNEIS